MKKRKKKIRPLGVLFLAAVFVLLAVIVWMAVSGIVNPTPQPPPETEQETLPQTLPQTQTVPPASSSQKQTQEPSASTEEPMVTLDAYEASAGYVGDERSRYEQYAALYPELDAQTVVKYVNMGLDRGFYESAVPVDDPASLTVLVNKYNYLPETYIPSDLVDLKYVDPGREGAYNHPQLRREAADAFNLLCEDAAKEGLSILGFSGYRSYSYQKNLYDRYCQSDPVEVVDTYSARPGYSEHQLGLAIDVCTKYAAYNRFGDTQEYDWAMEHMHRYGFILSYPVTQTVPGTQAADEADQPTYLHGYKLEEWHFRYVGVELATYLHDNGLLLDEYYALQANVA